MSFWFTTRLRLRLLASLFLAAVLALSFSMLREAPVLAAAPDGSGTLTASISAVSAASTGNTISLTYTAAAGGLAGGTVAIVVPAGWSPPATTDTSAGYTTASSGTV